MAIPYKKRAEKVPENETRKTVHLQYIKQIKTVYLQYKSQIKNCTFSAQKQNKNCTFIIRKQYKELDKKLYIYNTKTQ